MPRGLGRRPMRRQQDEEPSPFDPPARSSKKENPYAAYGARANAPSSGGAITRQSAKARKGAPNPMFDFDPELVAAFQKNFMFFRRVFSPDTFLRPLPPPIQQSIARSFGFFSRIFTQFFDPKGIKNAQTAMGLRKDDSRIVRSQQ